MTMPAMASVFTASLKTCLLYDNRFFRYAEKNCTKQELLPFTHINCFNICNVKNKVFIKH